MSCSALLSQLSYLKGGGQLDWSVTHGKLKTARGSSSSSTFLRARAVFFDDTVVVGDRDDKTFKHDEYEEV